LPILKEGYQGVAYIVVSDSVKSVEVLDNFFVKLLKGKKGGLELTLNFFKKKSTKRPSNEGPRRKNIF
jgi:hypothetical protein